MFKYSVLTLILLVLSLPLTAQEGFRIDETVIEVNAPAHWRRWIFQNDLVASLNAPVESSGLFRIDGSGVQSRYFRSAHNAALDAQQFEYADIVRQKGAIISGGATARSNDGIAARVIDGDLTTFWEPAAADFALERLREWELEIDLGRLIFADSIRVILPAGPSSAPYLGDPPGAFALFASMGRRFPFPSGDKINFIQLAKVRPRDLEPFGSSSRQFTIHLMPLDRADFNLDEVPDFTGSFIHYLKLKILDSFFDRAEFLGEAAAGRDAYQKLPAARRGAIVYQRLTAGGTLTEVDVEHYPLLPEGKQGPIRYFAREVPRVLEVEVWARGDNMVWNPEQHAGGSYELGSYGTPRRATDGLYNTEWTATAGGSQSAYEGERGVMWIDLGTAFWAECLVVVMQDQSDAWSPLTGAFTGHDFRISDGSLSTALRLEQIEDFDQLQNGLHWTNVVAEGHFNNTIAGVRMFSEPFSMRKVRFVQVRNVIPHDQDWGRIGRLAEVQLYGEGYLPDAWLYSPPIKLTDAQGRFVRKALPRIAWEAAAIVRTRDPNTGRVVERIEPLDRHPDVALGLQTRTSDMSDTVFTYFEVVGTGAEAFRQEISEELYTDLIFRWDRWNAWEALAVPHESNVDDDDDGLEDEDEIDFVDNDGDGQIDEDGRRLRGGARPRSLPERDGELELVGWSEWSRSYQVENGRAQSQITSPNPRRFLQVRANLHSEDPNKTVRLRSLRIELAPPLALALAGEVAVVAAAGQSRPLVDLGVEAEDYLMPTNVDPLSLQTFAFFIRAAQATDAGVGFDEVLVVARQAAELRGVRVGRVRVAEMEEQIRPLASRFTDSFTRTPGDSLFRDEAGNVLQIISRTGSDSLHLRFPAAINVGLARGEHALVEVQFAAQHFEEGVALQSFVGASQGTGFQRVESEAQDATELVASNTARLSLALGSDRLVQGLQLDRVLTPNGDGVNDRLEGRFVLLKILELRPLEVGFYDLAGTLRGRARVNGVAVGELARVGEMFFTWDGRDLEGELVPPGIYLCRIRMQADQGVEDTVRPVHVAY